MYYSKALYLFIALAAIFSLASASDNQWAFWRRQIEGTDPSPPAPSGPDGAPTPTLLSPPVSQSSASASDSVSSPSASAPPSVSNSPSPTDTPSASPSFSFSSLPTTSPSITAAVSTPTITTAPEAKTSIVTVGSSGGKTQVIVIQTSVISGSKTIALTSTVASASATASSTAGSLADSSNSNNSSGITQSTKNIIIGVAVGIGGAILLGALGIVAWRIWGRKKHAPEEDDFFVNDGRTEKIGSVDNNSPFKSTLDQYHNPAGRVNTAANF